jgi:hypothetical protein
MTQDEIIEMARQVGLCRTQSNFDDWIDAGPSGYELEAFAELIAAKKEKDIIKTIQSLGTWATCEQIEKAIKVRGIK